MHKLKIGLTRNRLFEPSSAVFFCGKYKGDFVTDDVNRAVKMLCAKYEILTAVIEFNKGGDAFLVTEKVSPQAEFSPLCISELRDTLPETIDFSEALFKFYVSSDNYLVIVSHTVVCDGKSLLRIAKSFVGFYERDLRSVEPSEINMFSDFKSLPVEAGSSLLDKLSANLDEKWNNKPVEYDLNDYKRAMESYRNSRESIGVAERSLSSDDLSRLREFSQENYVDASGVIAFCLYKSLLGEFKGKKKNSKLMLSSDRRYFLNNYLEHTVGAYDGAVEISLNPNLNKKPLIDQIKDFQRTYYKGRTSVFRNFYEDVLQMKLIPASCDAAYMYALGFNRNKGAQNLAENYTCLNRKLCNFSFNNLEQAFWCGLDFFSDISCDEAFRMQYDTSATLLFADGRGSVKLRYREDRFSRESAEKSIENTFELLSKLK